ncbi:metal-dependent transcriptional regulator [Halobellus rubicundus]|uniref:Metal-dependent transcriptional regulator n=1 Tax=Halobellus rubicundus TaxID=2996466 RepID=A0ABD5MG80_9EURY
MAERSQYLLALYIAEHRESTPVSSGTVADLLGKSTATTTETFQRLADDGLVEYERYEGARLTDEGRERAAELHETYVALSWFFRTVLDLDGYETEARRLASSVSADVSDQLVSTFLVAEAEREGEDE